MQLLELEVAVLPLYDSTCGKAETTDKTEVKNTCGKVETTDKDEGKNTSPENRNLRS